MVMVPPASEGELWESVLELTKSAQENNCDPLVWALEVSSILNCAGVSLPCVEVAQVLVSHICWDNNVPIMWKFLDKAFTSNIIPPLLLLALLSSRAVPYRKLRPSAYRLYLELLNRHVFSSTSLSQINGPNYHKIMRAVDDVLNLSQIFGLKGGEPEPEPGIVIVELFFAIVWQLLDASLDDEGLPFPSEEISPWLIKPQPNDMELDTHHSFTSNSTQTLLKLNTAMSIEIIGRFLQNKTTARILHLARLNMPLHWGRFAHRLQWLAANSAVLRNSKLITPDVLLLWTSDKNRLLPRQEKPVSQLGFHDVMASGSLFSSSGQFHGVNWSALWLPIDLFLEDAMDGSQVLATSAVEHLIRLTKSLQAVNDTSWHNTFLGLWIAALRLIQRERDPIEGPVPRLDTCLCMLLSISILAVTTIIEEEESELKEEPECSPSKNRAEKQCSRKCRKDLISSLQMLGEYEDLLTPPQSIVSVANQAAAKAIMFTSGVAVSNGYYDCVSINDTPINCSGNMLHLIVEACISRNLLDTSAYLWPGYVNARGSQMPRNVSGQVVGWSSLMKGCSLTPSMVDALVATPASSLAELEKIYEVAVNGSSDEKISAASILCGASLVRGWNVQEHTSLFIASLLSPPVPVDYSGSDSYLIDYASFLNVLLVGISSPDCVQIFSLHGMVPLLAGQLMPICEAFGSSAPKSWTLASGEELTCHAVFSLAFTLLLRLWRFHHPPHKNIKGEARPVGSQITPEYLLLVRNSQMASFGKSPKDQLKVKRLSKLLKFSSEPIFMESFPKLKGWYRQHQECIASSLSGLVPGAPVHQIIDALLIMMFRKINRGGQSLTSTASGSSNSSGSTNDESSIKLKLPAWDILEATPFVLDAALTACAHGRLSPRDLATGLKDLADFLPASFATIVSYFSAEVTRGIWKPAFMNGTDWPSPAATLSIVEQQIKKILAATGVDVPSLVVGGSSPAMLPLPLAALISLTITYKLDKASERLLALVGPALSTIAASCSWPCTPIIASLWAQKVKRWNDFLVFSASRTVFHHNSDAIVQLLKSCFTSTLGIGNFNVNSNGGIGTLLGHSFGSHALGGMSPVAPGILYLRVHRSVRGTLCMVEEIVSLLLLSVRDIAVSGLPKEKAEKLKKTKYGMRYGQVSFASAMTRVKLAASLGASLVWISGGSGLVNSSFKETLPSWFLSIHSVEQEDHGSTVAVLRGYALAYFSVLCGTFSWGIDSASPASKRRAKILNSHLVFLASALDGKFSIGCNWATWRAYVSGFVSLMVRCAPMWVVELDVNVLKRLSKGLRRLNEEELALALLESGGVGAMGAAAELIFEGGF